MKKTILVLCLILIFSMNVFANDYDFRNVNWGMNKKEVKANETAKLIQSEDHGLAYNATLDSNQYILVYYFKDNKLYRGAYLLMESYTNKNKYLYDYMNLKDVLTKKYGDPIDDTTLWTDDTYKNDTDNYGFAVSLGYLTKRMIWENDVEKITLLLTGGDYEVNVLISYDSKEYSDLAKQEKKEAQKDLEAQL